MRDFSADLRWLSINTATVRAQWPLDRIIQECARRGITTISPWRDQAAAIGLDTAARCLVENGVGLSGYCRGGMFPAVDRAGRQAAIDDTRRAIDEARMLGAPCLVLVVGGLPGALAGTAMHRDIASARHDVVDGIAAVLQHARDANIPLAIEPLHPMYAADRACINTLEHALDICDALDPPTEDTTRRILGVAVDVYHVWWDPKLEQQIHRAGSDRLLAFHVCDWLLPTRDLLNDRGMMGDGIIDIRRIRAAMEAAGYRGHAEVEIFSSTNWWKRPGGEVLDTCMERYRSVV
ncbi:sugar phosphate isomerase/epimerase family protein [Bordetella genomosp. 11]|uniref:Endonuclease n=1 Tax=Bordetella genomosp. 11 TaxID=1416808 RepID=A0A261UYQ9_9BORD|nr:sugar phosphate isomerase/epimerase family protein [Bordetella genomosp. 11]OZI66741.1 endonuclease [Bordetella genomosp. 11]